MASSGHLAGAVRRLHAAFEAAGQRAHRLGRPILAWSATRIDAIDPIDLVERSTARDRMLWARPDDRQALAGVGPAWTFSAAGPDRFARVEAAWRSIVEDVVGEPAAAAPEGARDREPSAGAPGPVAFCGFAFAPGTRPSAKPAPDEPAQAGWMSQPWAGFPDALITIPQVAVSQNAGDNWLILSALADGRARFTGETYEQALAGLTQAAEPAAVIPVEAADHTTARPGLDDPAYPDGLELVGEFPSAERWKQSVRLTAEAIREGRLRKAVLARGIRVRAPRLDPAAAVRALRADYPSCTAFAFARDGRWFLGATPERLVRVRNGEADVAAVAGTAPRGRTVEEDHRLAAMLLASPKDRIEHAIVVEALRDALADIGAVVEDPRDPRLLTVRNAHHLHTPLRFVPRTRQTVLALTGRLHPTPAVGGTPLRDALRWIHGHEGWDRGWYAGPIGWVGRSGDGEAAVAIRSALVHDGEALLFAGCGIVADSDPDQEYAESDLKLRPVASALGATAAPGHPAAAPRREAP